MKKQITKLLRDWLKKYSIVVKNLGYLTFIKVFNLILPLVVYPYLIKVLGAEKYGLVIFAEAIIMYFSILVSYGFNLSATKEVSINRNNHSKLNEIVSSVFIIKGFLLVLCSVFLFVVFYFLPLANEHKILFICTMYMCVYEFLFPLWFFQGIEKLGPTTVVSLISKASYFLLIFFFIKNPDDYFLVPLINGCCLIFPLLILFIILFKKFKIKLQFQKANTLFKYFKDSSLYFSSFFTVQILANTNKFLIGSLLGMDKLALYDIVEKIIRILGVPISMLRQVLLPYVANTKDNIVVRYTTLSMTFLYMFLVLIVWYLSPFIIELVLGYHSIEAVRYLKIYVFILVLYNIGNYYLVVTLNAFNLNKEFLKIVIFSLVIYFLSTLITWKFKDLVVEDFIYILLIVETFIVALTLQKVNKFKLL